MNVLQVTVCVLVVICGATVLLTAFFLFVVAGWSAKRKDIMDGFNPDARFEYFNMFGRASTVTAQTASAAFDKFYTDWYGRRFFIVPGMVLILVSVLEIIGVGMTGLQRLHYIDNPLFKLPDIAMAALAGAYLWVADDLIARARRLDMAPSDVLWGALRLTIAIPMGYAFAALVSKSLGPFMAFALGAFPLTTLTLILRRVANKSLGVEAKPEETTDDIIKLQGINRALVDRLSLEDVQTITQIAYCDPVRLIMRSSLTFNFVTDCMNQALAWMYLQSGLDLIRPLGLRGAIEISSLIEDFDAVNPTDPVEAADHARAVAAFPIIAATIKQDPATLQIVFRQIAEDPYTVFLGRVWT